MIAIDREKKNSNKKKQQKTCFAIRRLGCLVFVTDATVDSILSQATPSKYTSDGSGYA